MNNKIKLSLITTLCLTTLGANEFKPVGFKATGMGGTGVASSRGSLAGYYNPALIQFSDSTTEVSIDATIGLHETNLVDPIDKLSDLEIDKVIERIGDNVPVPKSNTLNGDNQKMQDALDILADVGEKNALSLSATAAVTTQITDSFAFGVYRSVDSGIRLNIDKDYLDLIFKDDSNIIDLYYKYDPKSDTYTAKPSVFGESEYKNSSLEYAINGQESGKNIDYIQLDAEILSEVPLSYAKSFDYNSGTYSFGINAKYMTLTTYANRFDLGESSSDIEDDSDDDNYETTYKPTIGIDLGFAYRPVNSNMTIGLMAKDINSPTFSVDQSDNGVVSDYKLDPLFRAGISVPFWNDNLEFALDLDLSKNDTIIEGEQSQMLGAGIEYHPLTWFSIRAGAMQDLASEKFDDGLITTAGVGFGSKWLQLDVSAMMSANKGTYDGDTIPRYARVNISLVSKWGDGYNRKHP